jgi:hypothetical protein
MASAEITKNIIISEIEESLLGNKTNTLLRSKLNQVCDLILSSQNYFSCCPPPFTLLCFFRENIREELNIMKEI